MKCPKCETKNADDAVYCKKCGAVLKESEVDKSTDSEEFEKQIEEKIEKAATDFGKAAERIGRQIERKFEDPGKYIGKWCDKTFGVIGPLIVTFLILIVLRIVIWGMESIGDTFVVIGQIGAVLYEYLLLIFISTLINSYNAYFLRKYKPEYQWVSPAVSSLTCVIGLWIVAKIFIVIDAEMDISVLAKLASIIETYIVAIFFIALILSYTFKFISTPPEKK